MQRFDAIEVFLISLREPPVKERANAPSRHTRAWAAAREILANRQGVSPDELAFASAGAGKPYLPGGPQFNLSHSHELCLLAVGDDAPVGIDVQRIRRDRPFRELAGRYLSVAERGELERHERPGVAFHWCWTAKEAYLKALGVGLRKPLASFDVTVDPALPPAVLADREIAGGEGADSARWTLRHLHVACGYAATLAVRGEIGAVRVRRWQHPPR